jgi:hypothetical protein
MENDYFRQLGFQQDFDLSGLPHKKNILSFLKSIKKELEVDYPEVQWDTGILDFTDYTTFAKTYLLMIRDIQLKD